MQARDLYGLPLERFTEERNALAKLLRSQRRREEAAEVAALRKPTVEAWAVNQLVRTQRSELDALFEAGDRLAQSQTDLLDGRGDPRALRDAVDAERTAVGQLTERARGLLSLQGRGLTAPALEHVSETLHAAALDEDARAQVRDGCLNVGLRHIGLGTVAASATSRPGPTVRPKPGPAPSVADGTPRADRRAKLTAQRQAEQHEATRAAAERAAAAKAERAAALTAARRQESDSRRRMERAIAETQAAQERRDRAATALTEAEQRLSEARERAQRATEDHRRARTALDRP